MTIRDLFEEIGTDIGVVISRFGENEQLLNRFIIKFPQDPSFIELKAAIDRMDYENIERGAHTLKGVTANLGFSRLSETCANLVHAIRHQKYDSIHTIFQSLQEEYEGIIDNINKLT